MQLFVSAIATSQSEIHSAAGSPVWQLVFVSFALVLVLVEALRGWGRGGARQVARLGALTAAYFAAFFGGNLVLPLARDDEGDQRAALARISGPSLR